MEQGRKGQEPQESLTQSSEWTSTQDTRECWETRGRVNRIVEGDIVGRVKELGLCWKDLKEPPQGLY